MERTAQRPPERSLIEEEGLPISPINTSEVDATVDGLRPNNEEYGSLEIKGKKKSKKKKGNGVKKFFKKILKNMFEEKSGGAGSAGAGDGGLEGRVEARA